MRNSVSINLRKDEIIIKLSEDAEQREIVGRLRKKLPELKKLYQDEKTPIKVPTREPASTRSPLSMWATG